MVCLGTPQTSRLQILWWWYSILTVYNKESWLIIGIEILSPIRFFWVLQSQYFISHTLAARAWIVLCFLQCVIFITLKRGFSGITGRNALTAVCRDRRRSTLRNTSTEEGQIKWKHWEREMKARGLYAWLFCCSVAWVAGCAKLSIHLSMPTVLLHLPVVPKELATHIHTLYTHTKSSVLPCTQVPTSFRTHTNTHTEEIRAEGQGGVQSAFSANPLFLHLSSSTGIISYLQDMAFHSPLWKKRK